MKEVNKNNFRQWSWLKENNPIEIILFKKENYSEKKSEKKKTGKWIEETEFSGNQKLQGQIMEIQKRA